MFLSKTSSFFNKHFTYVLTLVFFIFVLIGTLNHEMWRDEFQSWMLARESTSLFDMLDKNKDEIHPPLWYLILFVFTRITADPIYLQVFHTLIITGVIFIFLKYSPFTNFQKIIFCFGYYPLFEYGIISRVYSLTVLLMFIACVLIKDYRKNIFLFFVILALLANTTVYGFIIAICFAVSLLICVIKDGNFNLFKTLLGVLLFLLSLFLSYAEMKHRPESTFPRIFYSHFNFEIFIRNIMRFTFSYFPIPSFSKFDFWGTNILLELPLFFRTLSFIVLPVFILSILRFVLFEKILSLTFYFFSTAGLFFFSYLIDFGSMRHNGHFYFVLILSLWMLNNNLKENKVNNKYIQFFLNTLFLIHMIGGIYSYAMDIKFPFTAAKEASKYIKNNKLDDCLIIGSRGTVVIPSLSGYLKKTIYSPETKRFDSFITFDVAQEFTTSLKDIFQDVVKFIKLGHKKILLVLNYDVALKDLTKALLEYGSSEYIKINIKKLPSFTNGIVRDEKYYLYLIEVN